MRLSDEYEAETSHPIEPCLAAGRESRDTAQQLQDTHPGSTVLQFGMLCVRWSVAGSQRSSIRRAELSCSADNGAVVAASGGSRLLFANTS